MMEKYGVDMSNLPATDDQIRQIGKLCHDLNQDMSMPKNREDADRMIEKLASQTPEEGEYSEGETGI